MNAGGRTPRLWATCADTTMGRPQDDQDRRMIQPSSRRWAWRALLSALAGGGLSAGGLVSLPGGAFAAESPPTAEGTVTTTTPSETPSEEPAKTTTTTTTAPSTTTPASATKPSSTAPSGSPSSAETEVAAPPK